MDKRLTWYFVSAGAQGISVSLEELLRCPDLPNLDDDPLGAIETLVREAKEHDVLLAPNPVEVRDLSTEIVLTRKADDDLVAVGERIKKEYLEGEIPGVEYKSTLWLDLRRQENDQNASNAELRSPKIANSAMKTLCGFLNEAGGQLLIGVDDSGDPIGIEVEFEIACPHDQSRDGWLQTLRTTIEQFFHHPKDVSNHLKIELGELDGMTVCLISVVPRKRLSLCKCKALETLTVYARRGTSSESIPVENLEDYVLTRFTSRS